MVPVRCWWDPSDPSRDPERWDNRDTADRTTRSPPGSNPGPPIRSKGPCPSRIGAQRRRRRGPGLALGSGLGKRTRGEGDKTRGLRVVSRAIAEVSRTTQPVVKAQTRGGPRCGNVCDGRPQRAKEPQRDAIARPDNPKVAVYAIGVTPFMSWIRSLDGGFDPEVDFYYSVRAPAEAVHRDEIEAATKANPLLRGHYVYSNADGTLTADEVLRHVAPDARPSIYMCGPPAMMQAFRVRLPPARRAAESRALRAVREPLRSCPRTTGGSDREGRRIRLFDCRRGTDWSLAGRVAQSLDVVNIVLTGQRAADWCVGRRQHTRGYRCAGDAVAARESIGSWQTPGPRRGWLVNPAGEQCGAEHAKTGLAAGRARESVLGCQLGSGRSSVAGTLCAAGRSLPGMSLALRSWQQSTVPPAPAPHCPTGSKAPSLAGVSPAAAKILTAPRWRREPPETLFCESPASRRGFSSLTGGGGPPGMLSHRPPGPGPWPTSCLGWRLAGAVQPGGRATWGPSRSWSGSRRPRR